MTRIFLSVALAVGLTSVSFAASYYWDVGSQYENVFQPLAKETSNWRNADSSTARTEVPPGESDTIASMGVGNYVIPASADIRTNLRFGQSSSAKESHVIFDLKGRTWICPTVFWVGGNNTDFSDGFHTDIRMTNGNFVLEQDYNAGVRGFAVCGGGAADNTGSSCFTFSGADSQMTLPGRLYIGGSKKYCNPSRFAVTAGARLKLGGMIDFEAPYGCQFHAFDSAIVEVAEKLYVHGSSAEFRVGAGSSVTLSAIDYYQYGNGQTGASALPLTNNLFVVDGGTLNLTNATAASMISRANSNNLGNSISVEGNHLLVVKNAGVVNCSNDLWICSGVRGAKADLSGGAIVRAASFGSSSVGINGLFSVSNATLDLSGTLFVGNGSTTASTNYGTNHQLRVAGSQALVKADRLCATFASTLRFEIGADGFADENGETRAPVQIASGWDSSMKYSADKGGQKLDRIVVAPLAFDRRHGGESVVLMTFGTSNDSSVKAWAEAALANAVIEVPEGREAGALAMNDDYTELIYTAPKPRGLILLLK